MRKNFYLIGLVVFMAMASASFAEDIIAKTSNGSVVLLHDNGRWEYYQNNAQIRDVRPSAIPEDAKFEVSVLYESPDKIKKNVRMALEADFATEEEIKDSLRKVLFDLRQGLASDIHEDGARYRGDPQRRSRDFQPACGAGLRPPEDKHAQGPCREPRREADSRY